MGIWLRDGTIATTAGSAVVTGTGMNFIAAQIGAGDAVFLASGVLLGEVLTVDSATQLTMVENAASAGTGLAYKIQQTGGPQMVSAAYMLSQVSLSYQTVKDQAGAGKFGDGTAAAPGMRFLNDLDSGIGRSAANEIALGTGGAWRAFVGSYGLSFESGGALRIGQKAFGYGGAYRALVLGGAATSGVAVGVDVSAVAGGNFNGDGKELFMANGGGIVTPDAAGTDWTRVLSFNDGNVGLGTTSPLAPLHIVKADAAYVRMNAVGSGGRDYAIGSNFATAGAFTLYDYTAGAERWTVDSSGNLLVGVTSGSNHTIKKTGAEGTAILTLEGTGGSSLVFTHGAGVFGSGTANVLRLACNSTNSRSINAGGTINASGSDYAEYIRKALAYIGMAFAKGQVLGIDQDGNLTSAWSEAHSFVIKSYDPSMVGGDTWAQHLLKPVEPVLVLPTYSGPAQPSEMDPLYSTHLVAWQIAQDEHAAAVAAAEAAHVTAMAAYALDMGAFEEALEEARVTVDRVAFSGQAPVIVEGSYAPGQYLVAHEGDDDAIVCRSLPWADVIADPDRLLETRVVGKVWTTRTVQLDPADRSEAPEMVTRAWANVLHR